ncbi:MAG: putative sulfate exporter family transporter, partial [Syntrophomonas sp.]|nr:putative sulfate exporter family transporter [Syntrophomonas sp.]
VISLGRIVTSVRMYDNGIYGGPLHCEEALLYLWGFFYGCAFYTVGAAGNNTALAFATIVKLTRTLMIVPITLVLAIYTAHNTQKNKESTDGIKFSFVKVFPWFVIGFVATAIINTFIGIPSISNNLVTIGKFMIVMAMVAIGLNTNLKKLITNGFKPIFLGICCWFAVASISLIILTL